MADKKDSDEKIHVTVHSAGSDKASVDDAKDSSHEQPIDGRPDPETTEEDMANDDEADKPEADSDQPKEEKPDESRDESEVDPKSDDASDEPDKPEIETAEDKAGELPEDSDKESSTEDKSDDSPEDKPKDALDEPDEAKAEQGAKPESDQSVATDQHQENFKDMKFDAVDPDEPAVGDIIAQQARRTELARMQAEAEAKEEAESENQAGLKDQPSVATGAIVVGGRRSYKKYWIALLILLLIAAGAWWWMKYRTDSTIYTDNTTSTKYSQQTSNNTPKVDGLQLDPNKNYGDKYKAGLLPVGDGRYMTSGAKKGYVYSCDQYAKTFQSGGAGAQTRGPWFSGDNKQYDINKKLAVQGSVKWTSNLTNKVDGTYRIITTNDLPGHATGTFPVSSGDPAYKYDKNPNSIKSQSLTYRLNSAPKYQATPSCMGGEVGVMLSGAVLFNAFDAGGRDAGAWEVQDDCDGHPEKNGEYHYHTFSSCIKQVGIDSVVGFALDGFPITGPQVGEGNILTTSDLDECHGIVSSITLDGKKVTQYHYVMTQDFPYSVSCFRGAAIQSPKAGATTQQPPTSSTPGTKPDNGTNPPRV